MIKAALSLGEAGVAWVHGLEVCCQKSDKEPVLVGRIVFPNSEGNTFFFMSNSGDHFLAVTMGQLFFKVDHFFGRIRSGHGGIPRF
jgi:hypothetical protein